MEVSGQFHALPLEKEPVWTLWSSEKFLAPAENRTSALQPIVNRYTDRAILPLFNLPAT
jgi:hypothetical protein